ncbi:MAG: right-handed parallel beta-helix repeat-containing protein, partial [Candidatus Thorarchaeota archaeon]
MRKKDRVTWFAISIVFILIMGNIMLVFHTDDIDSRTTNEVSQPKSLGIVISGIPHAPIYIDGDANFSTTALAEGWPGDGSSGNPFVIDNLDIDLGGVAENCINITNTQVNFTISNCYLTGANLSYGTGIYLENVTHGKLIGNTIYNNVFNILLIESHSVLIKNNTAINSGYSIYLHDSSFNNTIVDNNCSFNSNRGIHLGSSSNNNTVINNTSNNNGYGIIVYESDYNTVRDNICTNNIIYGVQISNGSYNAVADNFISYSGNVGIILSTESMYNTVVNNTCTSNNYGIHLDSSDSNTVASNTFTNNSYGIDLLLSSSNKVTNNTSTSNTNYGINLFFSNTTDIQWNAFVNNPTNGRDESGSGNVFD